MPQHRANRPKRLPQNAGTPLQNARHELFAQLIASGKPITDAYISAGYQVNSARTGAFRVANSVAVKTRVSQLKSIAASHAVESIAQPIALEIADRNARLAALQDRWQRMRALIDARAEDMRDVPGGQTGLLVEAKKPTKYGDVVEYQADTALLREMRETEKQAAIEVGQWSEKSETTWTFDGDITKLSPAAQAKMIEQLERVAFAGDQRRLEAARAEAVDVECRTLDVQSGEGVEHDADRLQDGATPADLPGVPEAAQPGAMPETATEG